MPKLLIIGDGEFAAIAYEYFTLHTEYEVIAFAVEEPYLKKSSHCGQPVVPFERVQELFPPESYHAFVAVTYAQLNRIRARLFEATRQKGYRLASYISPHAFVWRNVTLGENVFIFEQNTVQHMVQIGNNVILWSGNHIGHRSIIEDHCYLSSHVVVSGYCTIGQSSFVGVNTTIADRVSIGRDCFIGAGCLISRDTPPGSVFRAVEANMSRVSSHRFTRAQE